MCLANDITGPMALNLKDEGRQCFDKDKIALVWIILHQTKTSNQQSTVNVYASLPAKTGLNYFEVGKMGIEHALLPEQVVQQVNVL